MQACPCCTPTVKVNVPSRRVWCRPLDSSSATICIVAPRSAAAVHRHGHRPGGATSRRRVEPPRRARPARGVQSHRGRAAAPRLAGPMGPAPDGAGRQTACPLVGRRASRVRDAAATPGPAGPCFPAAGSGCGRKAIRVAGPSRHRAASRACRLAGGMARCSSCAGAAPSSGRPPGPSHSGRRAGRRRKRGSAGRSRTELATARP